MNLRKTLDLATKILEQNKIPFALIGGFALAAHGVHRATQDIDLLVNGKYKDSLKKILSEHNFLLRYESDEVLQFGGEGFLDILLANRPISQQMIESAQQNSLLKVRVLQIEDIIGLKIQAYKNDSQREFQDKADIFELIKKNKGLDTAKIKTYAELFNEWDVIKQLIQRATS